MKKIVIAFGVFSLLISAAHAQPKIALIDLRKVFDEYYKTKQADANLKDEAGDLEKQRKEMLEDLKKGEEDWKKLIDKSNDQAMAAEERANSKKAAEKKYLELKDTEQTVAQFERSSRAKLGEKQRRKRDAILVEIREIVNKKAKAAGYTMVVDSAASSINDTPVILYNNGENDLTTNVLTQLNASAPPLSNTPAEKPPGEKPSAGKK
ncbi:MAG: OmpH family outer membrane protein [Verrucomicrobiota bacterium]